MSVTAYGHVYLGFPVTKKDFIATKVGAVATCPEGHEHDGIGPYCPKDGGRFTHRVTEEATPALIILTEFFRFKYDSKSSAEDNLRNLCEEGFLGSFDDQMVAGLYLSRVSDYSGGSVGHIRLDEYQGKLAKVEAMRLELRMEDRLIQIYHSVRLS